LSDAFLHFGSFVPLPCGDQFLEMSPQLLQLAFENLAALHFLCGTG
jgi:hypothetical protein